jgi:hypothetical protein
MGPFSSVLYRRLPNKRPEAGGGAEQALGASVGAQPNAGKQSLSLPALALHRIAVVIADSGIADSGILLALRR